MSDEKITFLLVNLTWNSNNWQQPSEDKSNHKWVDAGNTPHESWNFDFNNVRNTKEEIRGYAQFTKPPKVTGANNLIIFHSQNQIVGFYGKAVILPNAVEVNAKQSFNLIASRTLAVVLSNKIVSAKEKGYFDGRERMGQVGFIYLETEEVVASMLNEALELNPHLSSQIFAIKAWVGINGDKSTKYWVFQASPKVYRIVDALRDGILKTWTVSQNKSKIGIGDKVILWATGANAGVYALATITSPVYETSDPEEELPYYTGVVDQPQISDKVDLKLDYNLVDDPILKPRVLSHAILKDLKHSVQGTNLAATEDQYNAILKLIEAMPANTNNNSMPLNQILYGPPGTGKTYTTIETAIRIANPQFIFIDRTRKEIKDEYERLQKKGQVEFVTFHQSMTYEDFIEGIKPVEPKPGDTFLQYETKPGIFKRIVAKALFTPSSENSRFSLSEDDFTKATFYKISLGNTANPDDDQIFQYCMDNNCIALGWGDAIDFTGKSEAEIQKMVPDQLDKFAAQEVNMFIHYLKQGDYVVVSYGNLSFRAIGIVTGDYEYRKVDGLGVNQFKSVRWLLKNQNIPVEELYYKRFQQQTLYKLNKGEIKKEFFVKGEASNIQPQVSKENYVLVIDEINRGNISQIFGELITLIEDDKRKGREEELEVLLPYSGERFSVPDNLYIIGTMNTADRSVEALDSALRRRFSFIEMQANPKHEDIGTDVTIAGNSFDFSEVLATVNKRLEKLISRDHQIGHSYFLPKTGWTWNNYLLAFNNKIIPLLQEYFYGDYAKMCLVVGRGFVELQQEQDDSNTKFFADAEHDALDSLLEKQVWRIKPINTEADFANALNLLLNK
ncbi:AAA family ATPase [Segetibacter koreensis]|uniref:AAA family ATPase n=1 Tax=Segetibacter koreensis TaxID=398037 RepID=UPI000371B747|nr:AAA family ATPase [Segetibacter koreensis]